MGGLVVATLNLRNTADRWRERAPLLVEQLVELDPDVISVQEVRRIPDQARWIAREASRRRADSPPWEVRTAFKTGPKRLWEGVAVFSRPPVEDAARIRLRGQSRVALRVTVMLADGRPLDVYSVHLADGDEAVRVEQARRLLAWMDERPGRPAVVMGDCNSRPGSAPIRTLTAGGRLRSAYALVHGSEPPRTVPPGGKGGGTVLDYVFVNDEVVVHDAWLAFDRPSPTDPELYPSDHLGVAASISLVPPG
ncbi:MAG: hypothetical protein QOH36_649 [Actinomycetota bacterium]|nr:hypothetical protein [Actinomycetota bacterium]